MGTNFHTAWTTLTGFSTTDMNTVPSTLDRAISYLKNVIICYDGDMSYSILTGIFTWDNTIRIIFTNSGGYAVVNTISASNITLTNGQVCYVDLNETDGTVLTMQKATVTPDSESNIVAYNRLVLGYRNAADLKLFSQSLDTNPDILTQSPSSGDTVSIDWSLGSLAVVDLDRASTTFSFDGARDGQRLTLGLVQDATGGRAATFGSEVRDGSDISLPLSLTATANYTDYAFFIYRADEDCYDIVDFVKGYAP